MATTDATASSTDVNMTTTTPQPADSAAEHDEAMPDVPPTESNGAADASQPQPQPLLNPQTDNTGGAASEPAPVSVSEPEPASDPAPPPPAGPRARRLQDLFRSSLQHTLTKISWDNFAACYPTAAARNPVTLQAVHRAMIERLRELCGSEFGVVLKNRDVVRRLNELEVLAADAKKRREAADSKIPPVGAHTLPPETVLAAHLKPQRRAQRQVLEERLAAVQAENAAKFARLAAQQAEAEQLMAALERALEDAASAAALLDGGDGTDKDKTNGVLLLTELARETRAAEAAMRGDV